MSFKRSTGLLPWEMYNLGKSVKNSNSIKGAALKERLVYDQ